MHSALLQIWLPRATKNQDGIGQNTKLKASKQQFSELRHSNTHSYCVWRNNIILRTQTNSIRLCPLKDTAPKLGHSYSLVKVVF